MAVYLINSYDITDPDVFNQYLPQVYLLLGKYGAEVLASDIKALPIEGQSRTMNAIIKFPSEEEYWVVIMTSHTKLLKR